MARDKQEVKASEGSISGRAIAARDNKRALAIGTKSFRVKADVTIPVLKQDDNAVAFTVLAAMYTGRPLKPKEGEKQMEAATLMKVADLLDNGKTKLYVVNAVLKSELTENPQYAAVGEDGKPAYVGLSFAVQKLGKAPGKRHREMEVVEIDPADMVEEAAE